MNCEKISKTSDFFVIKLFFGDINILHTRLRVDLDGYIILTTFDKRKHELGKIFAQIF